MQQDKLEKTVKENKKLIKENQRLLKKINSRAMWSNIIRVVIWVFLIVTSVTVYNTYVRPVIDGAANVYQKIDAKLDNTKNLIDSILDFS